ncbi:hypothetical protein ACFL3G_00185 [Planctomycetota bacterium]
MATGKNDDRKPLRFIAAIPEFIGVMAGISVMAGRWVDCHVRGLLGEKPSKPKQAVKTPVQIDAEKRIAAIEQEIAGKKRVKTKKKAKKKKKTVKKVKIKNRNT